MLFYDFKVVLFVWKFMNWDFELMKNFFDYNKYDFDVNEDKEWFFVYFGVVININLGLMVDVYINIIFICFNMINW